MKRLLVLSLAALMPGAALAAPASFLLPPSVTVPAFEGFAPAGFELAAFEIPEIGAAKAVPAPPATVDEAAFAAWLKSLRKEAAAQGVPAATLDDALNGLQPIPKVLDLENTQPEHTITYEEYLARVVSEKRVALGREKLALHKDALAAVTQRTGVPSEIIVALWGVESYFGQRQGDYPIVAALATLAFGGKRPAFYRGELHQALKILAEEGMPSAGLKGSWAGAMGQCQFMPSSYRRLAVDGNGDGKRDIWNTPEDVFASAGNYLQKVGWKAGEPWSQRVLLPPGFDAGLADGKYHPLSEWKLLGVKPWEAQSFPAKDLSATLMLPGGITAPAVLAYPNLKTILNWNRSAYFATSIGFIADAVAAK